MITFIAPKITGQKSLYQLKAETGYNSVSSSDSVSLRASDKSLSFQGFTSLFSKKLFYSESEAKKLIYEKVHRSKKMILV